MLVNKDILTVKDLNKYLPALKTEIDIHFHEKLKEGLFKVDALVGLKKIPSESIDLIVTEPALDPNSGMSYSSYIKWIEEWVSECKRVLTASGSIYIICPWESSSHITQYLEKNLSYNQELQLKDKSKTLNYHSGRTKYQIFGLLLKQTTIFLTKII